MTQYRQSSALRASVIVPVYNVVDYLASALQSLFEQTISDFEIIVIDDGSTDGSWQLLQRISAERNGLLPALTVRRQDNAGPSAARNAGIEIASADIIGFLDGDDLWHADKLERHLQLLNSRPEIDLSFSWFSSIDSGGQPGSWTGKPDTTSFRSLVINNSIMTSLVVARRAALLLAGGFDESLRSHVDFDLWLRMANLRDKNFAAIEAVLVKQRTRAGQITSDWRRMEINWRLVMDKARVLQPETVAEVEREALCRQSLFLAKSAYRAGDRAEARSLLARAWRSAPRVVAGSQQGLSVTAAVVIAQLPEGLSRPLFRLARRQS